VLAGLVTSLLIPSSTDSTVESERRKAQSSVAT
jgi:hypothetical protein